MPGFKDRGRGPKPRNAEASEKGRIECGPAETLQALRGCTRVSIHTAAT